MSVQKAKLWIAALAVLQLGAIGCDAAEQSTTSFRYPPWRHTWGVVKARPYHLRLFLGDRVRFDDPQGLACVRLDSWEDTTKTSDDDEVTVYGVNSGENCIVYNRSMYSLGIFGVDPGQPRLDRPWGIAADRTGRVYIADRGTSRVLKLKNDGQNLKYMGSIGSPGDSLGEFLDPRGVALIADGRVFVTDAALGRVTVFNDLGKALTSWEGMIGPDGIAAIGPGEPDAYYPQDAFVIVIDSSDRRVSKFSLDGMLLAQTAASLWGAELTPHLAYCVLDYYNQILITDRANGCIHKLDRNLNYLCSFGESGSDDYQFDEPRGIALYRRFGQTFIAEREGAQYLWVGVDVFNFNARVVADSIWRELKLDFHTTEPAYVDLDVYDDVGRFITRFASRRRCQAGANRISWNMTLPKALPDGSPLPTLPLKPIAGEQLPAGRYRVKASFRATYSSREDFSLERSAEFQLQR